MTARNFIISLLSVSVTNKTGLWSLLGFEIKTFIFPLTRTSATSIPSYSSLWALTGYT